MSLIIPCSVCKHFNKETKNCHRFIKKISLVDGEKEYYSALSNRTDSAQIKNLL